MNSPDSTPISGGNAIITLLTDFGESDGYVGAVKGVLLSRAPQATIIDIAHQIPPQDCFSAALALETACSTFPPGTIHIAVVDPGVGSKRRALACQAGEYYFLTPDNGLLTFVLRRHPLVLAVNISQIQPPQGRISFTFHARDIFAPAAAHLAGGGTLEELGDRAYDLTLLDVPAPTKEENTLTGQVIYIDTFGNLITNITEDDLAGRTPAELLVQIGSYAIKGLAKSYFQGLSGKPLALLGSGGRMEIAVGGKSAKEILGVEKGEPVVVQW
jgi:S-adenosylmethionine hydrolase